MMEKSLSRTTQNTPTSLALPRASLGFSLVSEHEVTSLGAVVRRYKHNQSGATIISIHNDDPIHAFVGGFRLPQTDDSGLDHILEHVRLDGNTPKLPLRRLFDELQKRFYGIELNGGTINGECSYPISTPYESEFKRLVPIVCDALLHARCDKTSFLIHRGRFVPDPGDPPVAFSGVLYNEVKGYALDADFVIADRIQRELFPLSSYGVNSGGTPEAVRELQYEEFLARARDRYHPSDACFVFYGSLPPEEQLSLLEPELEGFTARPPIPPVKASVISPDPTPRFFSYPVQGKTGDGEIKLYALWNIPCPATLADQERVVLLAQLLVPMPGYPLKALQEQLLEQGLYCGPYVGPGGDRIAIGLTVSVFSKDEISSGVAFLKRAAEMVPEIAANELFRQTVLTNYDYHERRSRIGPRRAAGSAFAALSAFQQERDLAEALDADKRLRELIVNQESLVALASRVFSSQADRTLVFIPDAEYAAKQHRQEQQWIKTAWERMAPHERKSALEESAAATETLLQANDPEMLALLPKVRPQHFPGEGRSISLSQHVMEGCRVMHHDVMSRGLAGVTLSFDTSSIDQEDLELLPLLALAMSARGPATMEADEYAVARSLCSDGLDGDLNIATTVTGGLVERIELTFAVKPDHYQDACELAAMVITGLELRDREFFQRLLADQVEQLPRFLTDISEVGKMTRQRAYSPYSAGSAINEHLEGRDSIQTLLNLHQKIESDWKTLRRRLERVKKQIFHRSNLLLNVSLDSEHFEQFHNPLKSMLAFFPQGSPLPAKPRNFASSPVREFWTSNALVCSLAAVVPLRISTPRLHAAGLVGAQLIGDILLADSARGAGGTYGVYCGYGIAPSSIGIFTSQDRDPAATLALLPQLADFLQGTQIPHASIEEAAARVIARADLPSDELTEGGRAFHRFLTGTTREVRAERRRHVCEMSKEEIQAFASLLAAGISETSIVVSGSEKIGEKLRDFRLQTFPFLY